MDTNRHEWDRLGRNIGSSSWKLPFDGLSRTTSKPGDSSFYSCLFVSIRG